MYTIDGEIQYPHHVDCSLDGRYLVRRERLGHPTFTLAVRFCEELIGVAYDPQGASKIMEVHAKARGIPFYMM